MKKSILIICSIVIVLSLCACSNSKVESQTTQTNQIVNPISDCTIEEIEKELNLKEIKLEVVTSSTKIKSDNTIYEIDVVKDNKNYSIRIAKAVPNESADISGVYLEDNSENAIFDSADTSTAPSMTVASDNSYSVAYCEWNCYFFSVSAQNIDISQMQAVSTDFAKQIINLDNIIK